MGILEQLFVQQISRVVFFISMFAIYAQSATDACKSLELQILQTDPNLQSLKLTQSTQTFLLHGWVQTSLQNSFTIFSIKDSVNDPVLSLQYDYSATQQLTVAGQTIKRIYQSQGYWLFFLIQVDQAGSQLTVYFNQPQNKRDYYNKYTILTKITIQANGQIVLATSLQANIKRLKFFNGANFASIGYSIAQSFMFQDFQGYQYSFKLDQEEGKGLFKEDVQSILYNLAPTTDGQLNKARYSKSFQGIQLRNTITTSSSGQQTRDYSTFLIQNLVLNDPFFIGFYFRLTVISQTDNNIIRLISDNLTPAETLSFSMIQNSIKLKVMDKQYQLFSNKLQINQWYFLAFSWISIEYDSTKTYQSLINFSLMQVISQSLFHQTIYLQNTLSVSSTTYSIYFGYVPSQFNSDVQDTGITGYISRILIGQGGVLINNTNEYKATCPSQNQCDVLFVGRNGSSCQLCSSGYLNLSTLDDNLCSFTSCPSGYFFSNEFLKCQICNKACKTCFGPGNDSCSTCIDDYYSYEQSCFKTIPEGYYISDQVLLKCAKCNLSCLTCSGPGSNQCTSCFPGFYLNVDKCTTCDVKCTLCTDLSTCQACIDDNYLDLNNSCISSCPSGQYPNIFRQCQNCILSNCSECSTIDICIKCKDGFYLQNNKCESCHSDCAKCYGGDNQSCFACNQDRFLNVSTCLSQSDCNAIFGKFSNFKTQVCQDCLGKCSNCTSETDCVSCIQGYYFQENQCLPCPAQCLECTNSSVCTSCQANFYLDNNQKCSQTCPDGTFPNSNNQCQQCIDGCLTCFGESYLECYTCNPGYFFEPLPIANNGSTPQPGTCIQCDKYCQTCTSRNFCNSCKPKRFMKIIVDKQICTDDCGDYYLGDEQDYLCKQCASGCKTCSISTSNCQSCITGYFNTEGKVCNKCLDKCIECQQIGYCTKCANGFLLEDNLCKKACLKGFADYTKNLCIPCHPSCDTCKGALATDCLTCTDGFYLNTSANICQRCDKGCKSCTSKTVCTACNDTYNMYQNYCRKQCPIGTYVNNKTCQSCKDSKCEQCTSLECVICKEGYVMSEGVCKQCDPSCKKCNGTTATSCTACDYETKGLILSDTSCISQCATNQYQDQVKNQCLQCDYTCSSCFGPLSTQCYSCKIDGFFLTNQTQCKMCHQSCLQCSGPGFDSCISCAPGYNKLGDSVCVQTCPDRFYLQNETKSCQRCDQVCLNCNGSKNTDCTSCAPGYYQSISSQQNIICSKCNPKCLTCNGAFSSNCILCSDGYVQYKSQCEVACPSGFRNVKGICTQCPENCGYCVQSNINNTSQVCTQCLVGYMLNQIDNTCVSVCPQGTFQAFIANNGQEDDISSYYCQPCDEKCIECSQTKTNCSACKEGYTLHEMINQCVQGTACLNGFVGDIDTETNKPYCKVCRTNCIACISKMYYFQDNCQVTCPAGTSPIYQSNICVVNLLPELTITTDPSKITFQEDVTIESKIQSSIAITGMSWSLLSPSPISIKGIKFLQNLILNNIDTLYIPLQNLVAISIYEVQFTVTNFKGSASQKIKIDTSLMLSPGSINCNPNSNIFSGTTQIQVTALNFIHAKPLSFDYLLSPVTRSQSIQTINNLRMTSEVQINREDLFIIKLNTDAKQQNLTTYPVRTQTQMNVFVNVFNDYTYYQASIPVQLIQGSIFTYNSSDINQDLNKFDQIIQQVTANSNKLTKLATYVQDIRSIREILKNYIKNAYSLVDQSIYLQRSFIQLIDSDISCKLNLCMNKGQCTLNSVQCLCNSDYKGPKCQFDIKRSQQLSTYLETVLGFIYQNRVDNLEDDALVNVLMDISFFRDMLDVTIFPTYFQILQIYMSTKVVLSPKSTATNQLKILTSKMLSYSLIFIYENLNAILMNIDIAKLPDKPTYLKVLRDLKDISIFTLISNQNEPLNIGSPYHYYASVGVITSSMFPQILDTYQSQQTNTSQTSTSLLMRNLQDSSETVFEDNQTEQSGIVGYEFGTGLDTLKALFNFPVISFSSNRHFIYIPQSIISSQKNLRILIAEIYNIVSVVPNNSKTLTQKFLLATGFFSVTLSQNQQIIPFENQINPLTIFLPKMINYPTLNYTNPKLPVYDCIHYDEERDIFESDSCFFQRENSTHIACSCYTAKSYISVQIIRSNIKNLPSYEEIIVQNSFTFDEYVAEKLRVYKQLSSITDSSEIYVEEEQRFQQLIILQNYYGLYIIIVISLGLGILFIGYSSIKAKYFDKIINSKDHQRTYFFYYFPIISFLAGPTNQYVTSYSRAVISLTIIALHFAFSSFYMYIVPFDITTNTSQFLIAIITVSSTSVLIYWTIGIYHMVVVGLNNKLRDEKSAESKWKVVEGFKYSFGVTIICIVLTSLALVNITIFIGFFRKNQLDLWVEIIQKTFLYDLILDSIIVVILILVGSESLIGSFFSLRGYGITLQSENQGQNLKQRVQK